MPAVYFGEAVACPRARRSCSRRFVEPPKFEAPVMEADTEGVEVVITTAMSVYTRVDTKIVGWGLPKGLPKKRW